MKTLGCIFALSSILILSLKRLIERGDVISGINEQFTF